MPSQAAVDHIPSRVREDVTYKRLLTPIYGESQTRAPTSLYKNPRSQSRYRAWPYPKSRSGNRGCRDGGLVLKLRSRLPMLAASETRCSSSLKRDGRVNAVLSVKAGDSGRCGTAS